MIDFDLDVDEIGAIHVAYSDEWRIAHAIRAPGEGAFTTTHLRVETQYHHLS